MTAHTWLLYGAFASLMGALLVDFTPLRKVLPNPEMVIRRLALLGVSLLATALALLTIAFLRSDFSIDYVHTYSRVDYPWQYKLAGLWAGQKGTLLIWTTFLGIFGLAALRKGRRAVNAGALPQTATHDLAVMRRALLALLLLFVTANLIAKTFEATAPYYLASKPEGNGLQPVLLTPFMVIHPPLQFLAYAMAGVIFAAAWTNVTTGRPHWAAIIHPWVRIAWLISTIGLGLGGLWAYYVLNFGGFWAWDPVETANLIAWFPLTLLLHSLLHYREGRFHAAAPLFGLLTLPLVLFSTVATRTGLWVSVHAFTDPSRNFARDPLERLLNILATGPLIRYLMFLFLATFLLVLVALLLGRTRDWAPAKRARGRAIGLGVLAFAATTLYLDTVGALSLLFQLAHAVTFGRNAALGLLILLFLAAGALLLTAPETPPPKRAANDTKGLLRYVEPRTLLTIGVLLLSLALLVTFLLEVMGVNGYERAAFDTRAPWIALPIFLTLSTLFLLPAFTPSRAATVAAIAGGLGLSLAAAFRSHWEVFLTLPALLLVATASLLRFLKLTASTTHAQKADLRAGALLTIGALAAFLYWGNPPTRMDLYVTAFDVAWWWAIPAFLLAAFALFAGALHRGRPTLGLAKLGALALIPLNAYSVATVAGILALLVLQRGSPRTAPFSIAFHERRRALRKSAIYILHFGLAMGLLGYSLATYESRESDVFPVSAATTAAYDAYTFRLGESRGVGFDPVQRLPEEVHADVDVYRAGDLVGTATMVYWLVPDGTPGHYDARVTVLRLPAEDVYIFPETLRTSQDELFDHINDARVARDPAVYEAELTVKILPGMPLVWSGLWILGVAMVGILTLGGFHVGAPAAAASALVRERAREPEAIPEAAT